MLATPRRAGNAARIWQAASGPPKARRETNGPHET
jgi:hypothetical protein